MILARTHLKTLVLLVVVMASAFAVVVVRHENRIAFHQLQRQEEIRDELQVQWGRLMLERATWRVEHSVAEEAGRRLEMAPPASADIVTVRLGERQ